MDFLIKLNINSLHTKWAKFGESANSSETVNLFLVITEVKMMSEIKYSFNNSFFNVRE